MLKPQSNVIRSFGVRFSSLYAPEIVFSADNVKKTVAKFSSMKPIRMIPHEPSKRAGVLIPLCLIDGRVELMYTLRAANLKSHRGQVSFPGGMQDVSDTNLEETALRETEEELGIQESDIEVWGSGNVIVTRRETSVTPVIGRIKGEFYHERLKVNPSEVEDVFTVSLEELCKSQNLAYTQFRGGFASMPVFLGGKLRVWGLTALLTHRFLCSLLPNQAYSHNIKYLTPVKPSNSRVSVQ